MPIGIDHHKAMIHDLKAAAKAWGYMSDSVKECIKYHEDKIKEIKKNDKKETKKRLNHIKAEFKEYYKHNQGLDFKHYCLVYEEALLEAALKYGVDPDSVMFYYEIKDGKGKKWT